jgi:CxxC motif-containing protein (DUF1111 family)
MKPAKPLFKPSLAYQLLLVCFTLVWTACQKNDEELILKLNGQPADPAELSAGTATIFKTSISAYDTPAPWVIGELLNRFNLGDQFYDDPRTANDDQSGGLGPLYVGFACGSCHKNAGSTHSTLFSDGGSGQYGFSSQLVFISKQNGAFFRQYGRVLHDQAIYGVQPEGKLVVEYEEIFHTFPDGETYALITPHYSIKEWYADSIAPEDLIIDVRTPLRHVGMGQIMALDMDELQRLAAQSNYPEYGISGRLNIITERNKQYIGVGGNKAQHADLTVELGFSSDMGVTSDRYPLEVAEGQSQMLGFSHYGIQIATRDMEDVDLYMSTLGVPARRNVNNERVKNGEERFYQAKCHLCHSPTLHTRQERVALLNGTEIPWLSRQTIHPYSDFLLHDMGPGLDSHYRSGLANGNEWRTTPLWGIGLQETVNGHTQFLHDGRARNLIEAIMWHDGEGAVSRTIFSKMSKEDRDDLIVFLKSL